MDIICPLCKAGESTFWKQRSIKPHWSYYCCGSCGLVFRDPLSWPTLEEEKKRYDQHINDKAQQGYRKFLSRIVNPLVGHCPPPASVLDFGCGPEPLLVELLTHKGFRARGYDPNFFPEADLLTEKYEAVVSTEVFEHLHDPGGVITNICKILEPGGILALMTQLVPASNFETWHYLSDLTHVIFFNERSLAWLADKWQLELLEISNDLIFFRYKPF